MNRFNDPTLRRCYDSAMDMYEKKHETLFNADGSRSMGNGIASFFWRGFDGTVMGTGFTDAKSRMSLSYAYWRAGQDAAKTTSNK